MSGHRDARAFLVAVALVVAAAAAACGGGNGSGASAAPHGSAKTGPGRAAREVCSLMVRDGVKAAIGSPFAAPPVAATTGDTFTCSYAFAGASLRMSVRDLHEVKAARAYYERLAHGPDVAEKLSGLGQRGFSKADGSAVVLKDAMVLTVDVTQLPANLPKAGIATELAAVVMGCWTGGS